MCDKKSIKLLEKRISDAKMILYDLKVFIKLGALAYDSSIIDDDLQLDKSGDEYYILFRTMNKKLQKAIDILDFKDSQKGYMV